MGPVCHACGSTRYGSMVNPDFPRPLVFRVPSFLPVANGRRNHHWPSSSGVALGVQWPERKVPEAA